MSLGEPLGPLALEGLGGLIPMRPGPGCEEQAVLFRTIRAWARGRARQGRHTWPGCTNRSDPRPTVAVRSVGAVSPAGMRHKERVMSEHSAWKSRNRLV